MTNEMVEQLSTIIGQMEPADFAAINKLVSDRKEAIKQELLIGVKKQVYIGCKIEWNSRNGVVESTVRRINPTYVRADDGETHNIYVSFGQIISVDGKAVTVTAVVEEEKPAKKQAAKKTAKKSKK